MRIARPLVIAALAASLVAAGGTAASASTNSPQHLRYGQESFVLTTTSSAPLPVYWASASGVFHGNGVFVTTYSNNQTGRTRLVAYIAGGSFWVSAQANGPGYVKQDWKACREFITSNGTYQIFNGMGRLWGLRGWGTYYLFSVQTFPRAWTPWGWTCNFNAPPIGTFTIIRASGPVFLPRHHF